MDQQGSVSKVTDANQNIQVAYVNDAFGRQIVAPGGSNPAAPNDLMFQTNWITATIGTKQYGISPSRIYDFETGRFLQRDPFPNALKKFQKSQGNSLGIYSQSILMKEFYAFARIDVSGKNIFNYASGNPTNRIDPTGQPDGAAALVLGGILEGAAAGSAIPGVGTLVGAAARATFVGAVIVLGVVANTEGTIPPDTNVFATGPYYPIWYQDYLNGKNTAMSASPRDMDCPVVTSPAPETNQPPKSSFDPWRGTIHYMSGEKRKGTESRLWFMLLRM